MRLEATPIPVTRATSPDHIVDLPSGMYLELADLEIKTPLGILRFVRRGLVIEVHFSEVEVSPPALA